MIVNLNWNRFSILTAGFPDVSKSGFPPLHTLLKIVVTLSCGICWYWCIQLWHLVLWLLSCDIVKISICAYLINNIMPIKSGILLQMLAHFLTQKMFSNALFWNKNLQMFYQSFWWANDNYSLGDFVRSNS